MILLWVGLAMLAAVSPLYGQVLLTDSFDVAGSGTGFALNTGVNSGINPPHTRLPGPLAPGLRYLSTGTKAGSAFAIVSNRLEVSQAVNPGRFSLSSDGVAPFDLGPALGVGTATPARPATYELAITVANHSAGLQRCSFALAAAEGDANTWDFGLQLYRNSATDNFYTIGKRIDTAASGLAADLNTFITNTAPGSFGAPVNLLIRVTDAGAETGAFSSRVQVSLDGGGSWCYDTASDPDLPNGWRLDGPGRYVLWDIAPNAGPVAYDNFCLARLSDASATLLAPAPNASNAGACPLLQAAVSNASTGPLTVSFHGREAPLPFAGPDFAIAVLPDTQNYAREESGVGEAVKEMWFAQTDWIVTNRVQHNIVYVAHLGDVVQNGDIKAENPNLAEWRVATNAMYRLENPARVLLRHGVPYGIAVGNHDQEPIGEPDGATDFFNQYFGVGHFSGRPYYGGNFGANNDSHFDLFAASGLEFVVLYFEFGRHGSAILNWANAVLSTNQHRLAIVVTHFAGSDTTPSRFSDHGEALYEGLKHHPNLFLMLGGHVFENLGEGSRSDTYNGRTVRTYVSNYQGRMNGGNGFMRLLYFSPSNNVVSIKTYSPWLDQFETDANSQMSFSHNLRPAGAKGSAGTPYLPLATFTNVAPGNLLSCAWPGLLPDTAYEWRVTVADPGGACFASDARRFTTGPNTAPAASNQFLAVVGDQPAKVTLPAADPDGDVLTFRLSPPSHGLVSDFDTHAGTLTYTPARGFRGLDRISFLASDSVASSPIGSVTLSVIAPADSDGDGLPDEWETQYGVGSPTGDDDGDGQSNLAEYYANTHPTNAASRFHILSAARDPAGRFTLQWSSVGGTRYRVQYAQGSPHGPYTDIVRFLEAEMEGAPWGQTSIQSFTDTFNPPDSPSNNAGYYRVQVVP